jgi:uncharacterized protein
MKIFLDTSSLFKLYHREADTQTIEEIFSSFTVKNIYLSQITKVEFASSIWKKVRTKDVSEFDALTILEAFKSDFSKYIFIATDSKIIEDARSLVTKYGLKGLRTLDSIQLATSISLASSVDLFITSDNLLKLLLDEEGLPTDIPKIISF